MSRDFQTVGVVGLGTMGSGIAEVFARSGLHVIGVEPSGAALNRGREHIDHSTSRAVSHGKLTEAEQQDIVARIKFTTALADVATADLVVEAVPEDLELKKLIFAQLDEICAPEAILATNTSSLSVTEISVATSHPGRVVGMHFFNPAPVMRLVEIVRTVVTEIDVIEDVEKLAQRLGKVDVTVGDRAGFIANSLLFGYLNHAASMYESKYVSREDLDAAMKLGCGLPMGPLALLDLIGLDTAYQILDTMYRQSRNRLHAPAPIFKQMITAGLLGRKSGQGFYTYQEADSPQVVTDVHTPPVVEDKEISQTVHTIGIIGSGVMAAGIAETCAKAGFSVRVVARSSDKAEQLLNKISRSMDKAVDRGTLSKQDKNDALDLIEPLSSLDGLADCDMVIEAVVEDASIKRDIFAKLSTICSPGTVLATVTSSLPVIECAMATNHPENVLGLHFFNPAQTMKLVEVVRTVRTGDSALDTAQQVCRKLGKHPVSCVDRAGFIVNALLFPYLNDAVKMVQEQYASTDDIDAAMKVGCGYPLGPFELIDLVGLDVTLAIQRQLYGEFREPGFAPAPLLEHLVTAGYLGRKTHKGFHDYS